MGITDKTRKRLWGDSGNRCAKCKSELKAADTEVENQVVLGDECHICAREPLGPRHNPKLSLQQLNSYNNLIILCRRCHKIIDDEPELYTVEKLQAMKANHTLYIRNSTEPLESKSESGEILLVPRYTDTVEKEVGVLWSRRSDIVEQTETIRFRGQRIAKAEAGSGLSPHWYELYRLQNGLYLVYEGYIHRADYSKAYLHGVGDDECPNYPLTLERLQDEFPFLATKAGLSRVRNLRFS